MRERESVRSITSSIFLLSRYLHSMTVFGVDFSNMKIENEFRNISIPNVFDLTNYT